MRQIRLAFTGGRGIGWRPTFSGRLVSDLVPTPLPSASTRPLLISSEIFRPTIFGQRHPLGISRASSALDLIRALDRIGPDQFQESPQASLAQLSRFHDPDYLAALQLGETDPQRLDAAARDRYRLDRDGNPVHGLMYSRPATACGGSLLACDLLASGNRQVIFNMGGGTHHGRPARASGFCYMNDPVLAILRLWDHGFERVAYVDLDAHHPDGVEDALSADPRLMMLSVHEAGRWPGSGAMGDRGGGFAYNLPVPAGLNDSEMAHIVEQCFLPCLTAYRPQIILVQCGADALQEDPLSRLALSNQALWHAVRAIRRAAPRLLALGGGGYNPWSVTRCWAGLWLTLNDITPPANLPTPAQAVLRQLKWSRSQGRDPPEHWFTTLADVPRPGTIRDTIRDLANAILDQVKSAGQSFPVFE